MDGDLKENCVRLNRVLKFANTEEGVEYNEQNLNFFKLYEFELN